MMHAYAYANANAMQLRTKHLKCYSYVVSFITFHERGLGVPPSQFMRAIPHYYGVELHHLAPNSISQAAIFVAVCEGYLGIEPH
jgi:hypothetical protein